MLQVWEAVIQLNILVEATYFSQLHLGPAYWRLKKKNGENWLSEIGLLLAHKTLNFVTN